LLIQFYNSQIYNNIINEKKYSEQIMYQFDKDYESLLNSHNKNVNHKQNENEDSFLKKWFL